jgi:type II secretory pathway component PulC
VALLAWLAACAERTPPPDEPLVDFDDAERGSPTVAEPAPAEHVVVRRRKGEIPRGDLDRVLAAGPGRLLARVQVKARLKNGKFIGWEVVRNPWADVDLVAGDVVLSVNGRTLEHPLELKVLWDDLRQANAIAVQVDRSGETFGLEFSIVPAIQAKAAP